MRASLVIPTLNEGEAIGHVIDRFGTAAAEANRTLFSRDPVVWEVLVIDGGSTDETAERARAAGARVVVEPRRGYGRAYMTGFAEATGEILATLDGDATYPVEEVPRLVQRLVEREIDFISCNRLAHVNRRAMTTEHRIGNSLLNLIVRVAYRHYLSELPPPGLVDSQSGMWIFRRRILDRVQLTQEGMAFSEELKLEVLMNGLRFEEVPIHYSERWGAPKLSSWRDGSRNLLFLIRKRLAVTKAIRADAARRLAAKQAEPLAR